MVMDAPADPIPPTPRLRGLPVRDLGGGLRVAEAVTLRSRTVGLAGLRGLPPQWGLLIPRCRSIHTFGMRFAIDLLFLDAAGRVVRLEPTVRPLRFAACREAWGVLEVAAGAGGRFARKTPLACAAPTCP